MSRVFVVSAYVVAFTASASAQGTLSGTVIDEDGMSIAGATVLLRDEAATTADDGTFTITSGPGRVTVIAAGFVSQTLAAKANVVVRLARVSGEVIEISGKAPEESKPLAYTMSAKDIASTPGAMNDALRAITILPAAARIPFSFGGVVLRGMSPRDSSVFSA